MLNEVSNDLESYKFVDLDARKVVELRDEIEVFSYVLKDAEDTVWSSLFLPVSLWHWRRTNYERDRTLFFGACLHPKKKKNVI